MRARERIIAAIDGLGDESDEAEVLALLSERLLAGRAQYGLLQLSSDRRDFRREAMFELVDGCAYLAAGIVRARREDAERPVRGDW
jgi:hypothetical protein